MSSQIDRNEIIKNFSEGIHCSQLVFGAWGEELGLSEEEARKLAGPFAGGMFIGETCGCVAGALLAIGYKYSHSEPNDAEGNQRLKRLVAEFEKRFKEKNGSLKCKELTGYDFSVSGEYKKALDAGVTMEKCPGYVNSALEILDELMQEEI